MIMSNSSINSGRRYKLKRSGTINQYDETISWLIISCAISEYFIKNIGQIFQIKKGNVFGLIIIDLQASTFIVDAHRLDFSKYVSG